MVYTRKDVSTLTRSERRRLVNALLELKRRGEYDAFVRTHIDYYTPDGEGGLRAAHMSPSFLPWHRRFLLDLENALRRVDESVTVPYWDWTRNRTPTAVPWTDDLLGGTGRSSDRQVMSGPFAYGRGMWTIKVGITETEFLTRDLGRPRDSIALPTARDLEEALNDPSTTRRPGTPGRPKGSATSWKGGGPGAAPLRGAPTTGYTVGSAAT